MAKMDQKLIAGKQPYEVRYFAHKHNITMADAKKIIKEHGPSRKACNEAVRVLKESQTTDEPTDQ